MKFNNHSVTVRVRVRVRLNHITKLAIHRIETSVSGASFSSWQAGYQGWWRGWRVQLDRKDELNPTLTLSPLTLTQLLQQLYPCSRSYCQTRRLLLTLSPPDLAASSCRGGVL